jgi:hypothetical protein
MLPAFSILTVVCCLLLGGCTDIIPADLTPQPRAQVTPPEPKKVTELANAAFPMTKLSGTAEISVLRPSRPPQGGDWMFCLKSSTPSEKLRFAVFIRENTIFEVRSSIVLDGCYDETYRPVGKA